jgi:hypothetical protein
MTRHDHVRQSTAPEVNREIREETARHIDSVRDDPERINRRLHEIDAEWNIERAIETLSSSLSLTGLGLALGGQRRWLALPVLVQIFLLQHAAQGWCPPLPLLRRLGFRTQQEIERERYTLRALLRDHFGTEHSDRPAELPSRTPAPGVGRGPREEMAQWSTVAP